MRILFMCTANSCRSQIAEAWARHLLPADWEIQSAGLITYPISPRTRAVMAEVGLDMAGQESKTYDRLPLEQFDLVVSLSEDAARFLPTRIAAPKHLRRPVPDPMAALGTPEEVIAAFRGARDQIRDLVLTLARTPRARVVPPRRDPISND